MKQQMQEKEGGLCLKQTSTSYQMAAKDEYASYIEQYVITPDRPKLSQAALETLAIIAYNEPITKTEIDDIRSVSSGSSIQTLVAKALIAEAGRADKIGRPILYRTSKRFLDILSSHRCRNFRISSSSVKKKQRIRISFSAGLMHGTKTTDRHRAERKKGCGSTA